MDDRKTLQMDTADPQPVLRGKDDFEKDLSTKTNHRQRKTYFKIYMMTMHIFKLKAKERLNIGKEQELIHLEMTMIWVLNWHIFK